MKINDFFKEKYSSTNFFKTQEHSHYAYPNNYFSVLKDKFNKFLTNFKIPDNFTKEELDECFEIFFILEKNDFSPQELKLFLYKKQKEKYENNTKKIIETFVSATNKAKYQEMELNRFEKFFLIKECEIKKLKKSYRKLFSSIDFLFQNIILMNFDDTSNINLNIINNYDYHSNLESYKNSILELKKNYDLLLKYKIKKEDLVRANIPVYSQYLLKMLTLSFSNDIIFSKYYISEKYNKSSMYDFDDNLNKNIITTEVLFNLFFSKRKKLKNSKKSFKQLLKKYEFFSDYYCEEIKDYIIPNKEIFSVLFILENIVNRKIYNQQKNSKDKILKELSKKYNDTNEEIFSYLIFYARETKKIELLKKLYQNLKILKEILDSMDNITLVSSIDIIYCILNQLIDLKILNPILNSNPLNFSVFKKILKLTNFIENS